jgi:hypothetical protein
VKLTFPCAAVFALALALPLRAQQLPPEPEPDHDHDHDHDHPVGEGKVPALTVTSKVDEVKDEATGDIVRTIRGSGTTGYPTGTSLVLEARLKGAGGFLDKKHQVYVDEQGRWEGAIDDLGRNAYKGQYEVRVTFDPQFQNKAVMNVIRQKGLSTKIWSQSTEIRFGTAEEEALEKADVDQFYARSYATLKKACDATFKEYDKQLAEYNRLAWGDFVDDISANLVKADRELGEFRRSRDNLRDVATYEKISKMFVITTSRLFAALTTALETTGAKRQAEERETAKRMLDQLRDSMTELDQTIGQVKIDPNWKPASPKPIRVSVTRPVVGPIDNAATDVRPRDEDHQPIGRNIAKKSRFGIVELGIGMAVLCGLAMLAILLKRK